MDAQLQKRLAYLFKAFELAMQDEDVPGETIHRVMNRVMHGDPRGDHEILSTERLQVDPKRVQEILDSLPPGTIVT